MQSLAKALTAVKCSCILCELLELIMRNYTVDHIMNLDWLETKSPSNLSLMLHFFFSDNDYFWLKMQD